MPVFRYPELAAAPHAQVPEIDAAQVVAEVFTSGSTGTPLPHPKHWGRLVDNVRAEAARLGVGPGHALVGTVPPQHMYGLESTVLMPLQCGAAFHAGHPFYPADVAAALAELPRPRALVTTPYHLRTLLAAETALPAADLLLSATAPLSAATAAEAETRFGAPLFEIYGCTETGQLASRRPARDAAWQTLGAVCLRQDGDSAWAEGGHVERPTRLGDVVELADEDGRRFLLHGRHADLVNIAGKRTSLAYLNHQLHAIPGVRDGVFVLPADEAGANPEGVRRLSALVVAPDLTPAALMQALRARIDPLFLPRPLVFVEALPRNTTGKLAAAAAQALIAHGVSA
ncbi:MAG: AMP-binding protein [Thiobacillus sp.]